MKNSPPNEPHFACGICKKTMCADCLSIAAGFEYLHQCRVIEIVASHDRIKQLEAEVELLRREKEEWKQFASIGTVKAMFAWMETEVWKKAHKPPKTELDKKLKKLEKLTRDWAQSRSDRTS